ncbi:MAG TPA: hypothetical protein VHZ98_01470 [Galbitalea sp.]|nr:hypothetical protein [Galbitalea sp.]
MPGAIGSFPAQHADATDLIMVVRNWIADTPAGVAIKRSPVPLLSTPGPLWESRAGDEALQVLLPFAANLTATRADEAVIRTIERIIVAASVATPHANRWGDRNRAITAHLVTLILLGVPIHPSLTSSTGHNPLDTPVRQAARQSARKNWRHISQRPTATRSGTKPHRCTRPMT